MADVRSAWNEAGERLQGLGATLKQHYAQQRGDEAGQTKEQVGDAFKKVGEALQGAFDALGAAAKDPAVKEDVKQAGRSVSDALSVTFAELSDDVKKAFDKRKGDVRRDDESAPAATSDVPATSATSATPATPATPEVPEVPEVPPAPTAPSTAAPAGPQDSGVDGGTAPKPDPSAQI